MQFTIFVLAVGLCLSHWNTKQTHRRLVALEKKFRASNPTEDSHARTR